MTSFFICDMIRIYHAKSGPLLSEGPFLSTWRKNEESRTKPNYNRSH